MKRWQFWLGVAISALFLYLALRQVDLAAAWQYVRTAQSRYLALGWLFLLGSYGLRILRWHAIVRQIGRASPWTLGQVTMAGYMANNILPARIGEIVRAVLLRQAAKFNAAAALSTIAVERVFDVVTALSLLSLGAAFAVLGDVGESVWVGGVAVAGLVGGVVVLGVWGAPLSDLLESVVGRVSPTWGSRLADVGRSFVQGLRSVGSVDRALAVAGWSLAVWGTFIAYAYWILRAYGMHISLAGGAFMLGVAGLGVSLPSAPGNVGVLEGANVLALGLLGIGNEDSRAAFALTYHVVEWVTTVVAGLLCLGKLGLSVRQLSQMPGQLEPADGA
jgi:uncharacterized membrane protein YbhN (UPF0104 family)